MSALIKRLFSLPPWIFINLLFSSVEYISLISIFSNVHFLREYSYAVFFSLFIGNSVLTFRYLDNFLLKKISLSRFNWYLLILGLVIVIYRSLTYAHVIDDFVLHMISGYYVQSLWNGHNFYPTTADYLYPLLQTVYFFFLDSLGIRITLFLFSTIQLLWFLNLLERFKHYVFGANIEKYFYINIFGLILYFIPELIGTHVTFMSDFYTVLIALEIFYIFTTKNDIVLGFLLIPMAILAKQSLGLVLIPMLLYLSIGNLPRLFRSKGIFVIALFYLCILIFPLKSFIEIHNPIGLLFNNIFKSPIAPFLTPRESDFRWGPRTLVETIYWPLYASYSGRYMEMISGNLLMNLLTPLFIIVPYIYAFIRLIKKQNIKLSLIIICSILFWSWQTGYGRYQVAMYAVVWMFIILNEKNRLLKIKSVTISSIILFILTAFLLINIRVDYGLRNFFLEKFFPPKIAPYPVSLFTGGIGLIGKDRYYDIYKYVRGNFKNIDGIVVLNRGVSTYYAFLAAKYLGIPVTSYISDKDYKRITESPFISTHIKNVLKEFKSKKRLLVLSIKDYPDTIIKSTDINKHYRCTELDRNKLVPQFQHGNYFGYVLEYYCVQQ